MIDELLSSLDTDTLRTIQRDLYKKWRASIHDSTQFSHELCCFLDGVTDICDALDK